MTVRDLRLGIDLGTSAVKAVAIDASGTIVASGEAAYPTYSEVPGQAEQDPDEWLQAAAAAVGSIASHLGQSWPTRVASIGLSGQLPTLVCLDEYGPVGRAVAWTDSRAEAQASAQLGPERQAQFYLATGMHIDGRYLAPMFRFYWRNRHASVRRLLSAKDFLCFALTGRAVTDPSTAAGYGVYAIAAGRWDASLCDFWGLDAHLLPEIGPANGIAGGLTARGARLLGLPPGVPVLIGAADSVAAALAMGGLAESAVSVIMGSSTIVISTAHAPLLDHKARYLLTPHAIEGWYGREMDILSTGTGFRWLCGLFGWTGEQFVAQALGSPPGANGLCFAPYLADGEQGALWNPNLRGVIHGLSLHHASSDIARAFLEGVGFEIRRCLDVLEEAAPVQRVVLSGHAAESPGIIGMLADMLNRPVQRFEHRSPSAIGAAMLEAGENGTPGKATHCAASQARPGPGADNYGRLYQRYLKLFPRVAEASDIG